MLRLIIIVLVLVIEFTLAIPILIVGNLIGLISIPARDFIIQNFIKHVFMGGIGKLTGSNVIYKGIENIPDDTPVLYVGNHSSFFDVIFTYPKLKGNAGFIAKKEFEKYPILSHAMHSSYSLFLDRDNIKEGLKTILKAVEYIKGGASLFVFPEGTRSRDGNMADFKEGSMKMAVKAKCPIIPVAISNTAEVFENHLPWIKAANVIIEFGKPIYADQLDNEQQKHLGKMVHDIILEMRDANYKEIENK